MQIKLFLFFIFWACQVSALSFNLMLDPAGDAKHAGRQIDDCFERGLTLQLCQQIKKEVEKKYPVRVFLTRTPGETLEPLQNAQFANRLGVQLYISIHLYHEPEERSKIHIYHFVSNPVTDFWSSNTSSLRFIRFDEAHKPNIKTSQLYAQHMTKTLTETIKSADIHNIIGLPFKSLVGISAPAIGIEMSVKNMQDWQQYVTPLCEALGKLVLMSY